MCVTTHVTRKVSRRVFPGASWVRALDDALARVESAMWDRGVCPSLESFWSPTPSFSDRVWVSYPHSRYPQKGSLPGQSRSVAVSLRNSRVSSVVRFRSIQCGLFHFLSRCRVFRATPGDLESKVWSSRYGLCYPKLQCAIVLDRSSRSTLRRSVSLLNRSRIAIRVFVSVFRLRLLRPGRLPGCIDRSEKTENDKVSRGT